MTWFKAVGDDAIGKSFLNSNLSFNYDTTLKDRFLMNSEEFAGKFESCISLTVVFCY